MKTHKQSGFTLLELLLYTSLMGIIVLAVSQVFVVTLSSRIKNQTIAEVEQQGTQVIQQVNQAIRNSESITLPAQAGTGAQLTLVMLNSSLNPTIFSLSNGAIQMQEGAGAATTLTNTKVTASALSFQNLTRTNTPGAIKYSFVLTYINTSGRNEYNFSKTFYGSATVR